MLPSTDALLELARLQRDTDAEREDMLIRAGDLARSLEKLVSDARRWAGQSVGDNAQLLAWQAEQFALALHRAAGLIGRGGNIFAAANAVSLLRQSYFDSAQTGHTTGD